MEIKHFCFIPKWDGCPKGKHLCDCMWSELN